MKILLFLLLAQQPQLPPPSLTTRAGLQEQLAGLQPNSAAAEIIRARLEHGDFQAGDRVVIEVAGEAQLSDTFTVSETLEIALPQVGSLGLRGVLRSELQQHVTTHLSQMLRNPVVEVKPLLRLLVEGQVVKPGYYGVAPEQPLADALNAAGGFTQAAKVKDMRLERGETRILTGAALQEAMGRGYSLDRLNVRAGDRLFVPSRGDSERTLRILGVLLALPVTVVALTRAF